MAKKQIYFAEAERLYVVEQYTLAEIASHLHLAEKTVRNWKEEGDWENKRLRYLKGKQAFHEELYEFARDLMKTIKEDMQNGQKVDPGRMYAFTRLLPLIYRVKEYEDVVSTEKSEQSDTQDIKDIISHVLSEELG